MSGTSHGYTGQRYDSETGLYYYKMRYYSPKLGRFLQADPIGYGAGLNMYAYVSNNPTTGSDPMGLTEGAAWGSAVYQAYLLGLGIALPEPVAAPVTPAAVPLDFPDYYRFPDSLGADQVTENVLKTLCERKNEPDYLKRFYDRVKPGGEWDYKHHAAGVDKLVAANFGNFNYGANAWALGLTLTTSQIAAGAANVGNTLLANFKALAIASGKFYTLGQGASLSTFLDQELDYAYVLNGYRWAQDNADKLNALAEKRCGKKSGMDGGSVTASPQALAYSGGTVSFNSFNSLLVYMGLVPAYSGPVDIVSAFGNGSANPSANQSK